MRNVPFGAVFGGIWLLVGIPFLALSTFFLLEERRFHRDAKLADGIVLAKNISTSRSSNGSTTRRYVLRYRFVAAGGTAEEGETQLSKGAWMAFEERAPVRIAYLPARPRTNRVHGHRKYGLLTIFFAAGTLLSAVGGTIAAMSLRGVRIRERLRREGVRTTGRVTRVAPMNLTINGRRQWRIEFEFRDLEGRLQRGSVRVDAEEAEKWTQDAGVEVLFDPRKPHRAVWDPGRETHAPGPA